VTGHCLAISALIGLFGLAVFALSQVRILKPQGLATTPS